MSRPFARVAAAFLLILAVGCTQTAEAGRKPCRAHRCRPPATTVAPTTPESTATAEATTTELPTTTDAASTTTTELVTTTAAPPAPQPQGAVPPIDDVGPRSQALTANPATTLGPGAYNGQRLGRVTPQGCGTYTFTDSELDSFAAFYPCVRLVLDHSRVNSGLWFEAGSHDGAEIRWSIVDGGSRQALRPKGAGTILVEDSWLLTHGTELDQNIHTETVQGLEGAGGTFDRVAFSIEPRWADWGTPITAVINVDGPFVFRDVIVGYWAGAWSAGGGYYAVYPGTTSRWVRPTLYHGGSGYWFPPAPSGDRLVDPTYL